MGYMSLLERFRIPTYDDPKEICMAEVAFDHERCDGCGMCAKVCPADSIHMEAKRPRMRPNPDNQCIFCGCCSAICTKDAVIMKKPFSATWFYKTIEHGEPKPPRL